MSINSVIQALYTTPGNQDQGYCTLLHTIHFCPPLPTRNGQNKCMQVVRSACGQERGGVRRVEWLRAWPHWVDPQGLKYTFKVIQYKTMIRYSLWLSADLEEYENVFLCFNDPKVYLCSCCCFDNHFLSLVTNKTTKLFSVNRKYFLQIAELITWDNEIKLCVNSRGLLKPIYDRTHIYSNTFIATQLKQFIIVVALSRHRVDSFQMDNLLTHKVDHRTVQGQMNSLQAWMSKILHQFDSKINHQITTTQNSDNNVYLAEFLI